MAEEIDLDEEFDAAADFDMSLEDLQKYISEGGTVSTKVARKTQVLEFMNERKAPTTTKQICDHLGVNNTQMLEVLKTMKNKDQTMGGVKKSGKWVWYLPEWIKED